MERSEIMTGMTEMSEMSEMSGKCEILTEMIEITFKMTDIMWKIV